jgi:hypothetical protein
MDDQDKEIEEIRLLIDDMQSKLVELFDELRELRLRVGRVTSSELPADDSSVTSLFSKVTSASSKAGTPPQIGHEPEVAALSDAADHSPKVKASVGRPVEPVSPELANEANATIAVPETGSALPLTDAKVARFLDPIAHELTTGDNMAEVIGELLQAAKEELITKSSPNEKVSRDMDIVLKFLSARGKRKIRPEERDNILRRLKRWQTHLTSG